MQKSSAISYDEIEKEIKKMQSTDKKEREKSLGALHRIAEEIEKVCTVQYMIPFMKMVIDTNEEAKPLVIEQLEIIIKKVVREVEPFLDIFREIFLTCREETRHPAAQTLVSCAVSVPEPEKQIPGIEKLICELGSSKFIMHRISSICLINSFLSEEKTKACAKRMQEFFGRMLQDPSLAVRRYAASSTSIIYFFYYPSGLPSLVERVFKDAEDSVRSCFVYPLSLMRQTEENGSFFLKMFSVSSMDPSWQVRKVSVQIIKVTLKYTHMSKESTDSIIEAVGALINDREELVREEVIKIIPEIVKNVPQEKKRMMHFLEKASRDISVTIRRIIPEALLAVAESLTKEEVEEQALFIMKRLLADEDSKTKMNTIFILCRLYSKLGPDAITHALTLVIADLESSNWRTRSAILRSISSLSTQIDKEYFSMHLKSSFFKMLTDPVWAVRKESSIVLSEIASIFGDKWLVTEAMPALEFLKKSSTYIHRISYVSALGQVFRKKWPEEVQEKGRGALLEMARDPVPQVRLAVAKAISETALEKKEEILRVLMNDTHPEILRAL